MHDGGSIPTSKELNMEKGFLNELALKALKEMGMDGSADLQWQKTRKDFEGEVTLVTFPLTRSLKRSPEQIGEMLGTELTKDHRITDYNVVKGFLNLSLSDGYLLESFKRIHTDNSYGISPADSKPRVMVEFSSPNTNKPLHLGHLRNNFLGWSVSRILEANGHSMTRVQIINDRGIHICKSMQAWLSDDERMDPESAHMKGDKLVGHYYVAFDKKYKEEQSKALANGSSQKEAEAQAPSMIAARDLLRKWEAKDEDTLELWRKMNGWVYDGFSSTYERMGVSFDKEYFESDTYLLGKEKVMEGLAKGIFFQKEDGSIWVDLEPYGMDQKLLLRSDGTAVYMTQDIGTAIQRFEEYPDLAYQVYTVGNEQDYHFKVLFIILDLLGYAWAKECYHLSYGMVDLPSGKMKSREGTVVDADELMQDMVDRAASITAELGKLDGLSEEEKDDTYEMVGLGALKYFLLKVDPKKRMLFDPQESIDFNGNTGPFIQYTHARIRSIVRKYSGDMGVSGDLHLEPAERKLISLMSEFPGIVDEAARSYAPSIVAAYAYDLAKQFNGYYQSVPILKTEETSLLEFRTALVAKVGEVISTAMGLLGIQVPERM